ncbi:MAG: exodeoxyribonuclease V subunit alpha [Bacteroidetes bacterium]|nr:exodeoxyribonuclease V subunit alpha [Bacteroidota bacterium]
MDQPTDLHESFASFFPDGRIRPWASRLSRRLEEGHICLPLDAQELGSIKKIRSLVGSGTETKPFMVDGNRLYFHRYFSYETTIIKSIHRLIDQEADLRSVRLEQLEQVKSLIETLQADDSDAESLTANERIDWQLIAAIQACLNNFTIVTGGPGTGKTTTVAKILAILYTIHPELSVALTAPTGKASVRMLESLQSTPLSIPDAIREKFSKLTSSTIHRLLKTIPDSVRFRHHQAQPLSFDVIVVDEASMIDVPLFAKLLDAVAPSTRIIFLGDNNQLASVEAGSVLGDVCRCTDINQFTASEIQCFNQYIQPKTHQITDSHASRKLNKLTGHVVELRRSRRFNERSGIGQLSRAVITNQSDMLRALIQSGKSNQIHIDTKSGDDVFENFISGYETYIKTEDIQEALNKLNSLRVLVTVREGDRGLNAINLRIEKYLAAKNLIHHRTSEFYENRPVLVTQNNNLLGLVNGDVGIVRKNKDGKLRVYFGDAHGGLREFQPEYLSNVQTLFAMTIHKSQGSEYNKVLVVLPDNADNKLLTRELLYTAITRAKDSVVLQGTEEIILTAAAAGVQRSSGIAERFSNLSTD